MDIDTGAVRALVNLPDYDPYDPSRWDDRTTNSLVSLAFDPSSLFRPIVLAIALESGPFGYQANIDVPDAEHHGRILRDAFLLGDNAAISFVGMTIGRSDLLRGMRRFGFGGLTGVDLPEENRGVLLSAKAATLRGVAAEARGVLGVTALQLMVAYAALWNDCRRVRPHLVQRIGATLVTEKAALQACSPDVALSVKRYLRERSALDFASLLPPRGIRIIGARDDSSGADAYIAAIPESKPLDLVFARWTAPSDPALTQSTF
jgi:cell division protein FtsI/penicillin-binding protein 2